jgi:hypothetical protein
LLRIDDLAQTVKATMKGEQMTWDEVKAEGERMATNDNGGPLFPTVARSSHLPDSSSVFDNVGGDFTVLDNFATAALEGLCAAMPSDWGPRDGTDCDAMAEIAYKLARAMMRERAKP